MKIVIVGAGLTGLCTYLHLKKHLPEEVTAQITIYERHDSSIPPGPTQDLRTTGEKGQSREAERTIGGGLGLAANGMRVLHYLSQGLHARVHANGHPTKAFDMRTTGGKPLGGVPAVTEADPKEEMVMISWRAIWETLRAEIPPEGVIITGKKVQKVELDGTIHFEDGDNIKGDLILATDGAKSVCRNTILEEGEKGEAEFQGLMNFGGFYPSDQLPENPAGHEDVVMTFGRKGFFGYGPCFTNPQNGGAFDKPMHLWWSTHTATSPEAPAAASKESIEKLRYLHSDCTNPVIQKILEDGIPALSTPTWTVPKLPRWHKGRVILVGDAAHALPSTSGQGVSQAFEDAVTLSTLLAAALNVAGGNIDDAAISKVGDSYTKLRKKRVEDIRDEAVKMQGHKREMGHVEVYVMYLMVWLFMKLSSKDKMMSLVSFDAKAAADEEAKQFKRT